MGYSERFCQICGISFNIGRIRTRDEPQATGWSSYGADCVVDDNPDSPCKAVGCDNIECDIGEPGEKEHIAGPACTCTQGYSGWRIAVDEMRDITACVCLVKKPDDWQPEPTDEDFEKEAFSCFLTGVSKNGVDEFDISDIHPAKHGVADAMIENHFMDSGCETYHDIDDDASAMPMHPKCFEIFKRASLRKFGKVEIDGLFLLKDVMTDDNVYERFTKFPQGSDLSIVLDQWYFHEPLTEYLAANPVEVPGLPLILQDCIGPHAEVVFDEPKAKTSSDPLAALSAELRLMVLEHLDVTDVAHLRLASAAFRQLPQSYFHHLVLDKMPWVWEVQSLGAQAKDMDWFRLWCSLCAADGGDLDDEKERWWLKEVRGAAYQRVQKGLEDRGVRWGNPEYHKTFQEWAPNNDEQCEKEVRQAYASGRWPGKKATEVNGLRNRRRVWKDVEEILRRIEVKNKRGHRERLGSPEE